MSEALQPNPNQMPTEEQLDATIRQFLGSEAVQGALKDAANGSESLNPDAVVDKFLNGPGYNPAERTPQAPLTDAQISQLEAHRGQPVTPAERAGMDAARANGIHTTVV